MAPHTDPSRQDGGRRARATAVPPLVREVVRAYLSLTDAAAPGLVQGLYLTGSVALDDFVRPRGDIDFVAVSAVPPSPGETAALQRAHARLAARVRRPFFEGPYVTWDQLADDPSDAAPGPYAHRGGLLPAVGHGRQPATWQVLSRYGVTMRGPDARDLTVDTSPGELALWARDSLVRYWRPWWERGSRPLGQEGLACLGARAVAWGVLGVSRAHLALTRGEVASKTAAGEYARTAFGPAWHRIVDECLRVRRGEGRGRYATPVGRRTDALAFVNMVIENALARS
ncbi:aminoglycoside adenylyltransferase domain-containing protein [Streptomyces tremellae]|uniref:Adenylyltransferase AadA C-terminal domain-containing protein n=1 Tax=Streptomyces tremellae TaxID=1124239 RepID=A0ABP7ENX1_9ACTN